MKKSIFKYFQRRTFPPRHILLNKRRFSLPDGFEEESEALEMNELWMLDLFEDHLNLGEGQFLDVGVNTGQTLLKLKAVKEMDYIGFEPNPHCVAYVSRLIDCNKITNARLVPVGLGRENRLLSLKSYSGDMDSSATLIEDYRPQPVTKEWFVPVFVLDTLKESLNLNNVSTIKIDVEGSELEVIQGGFHLIKEQRPLMLVEVLPVYKAGNQRHKRQIELEDLLAKLEYSIIRIHKNKDRILRLEELNSIDIHSDLNLCEYLFIPREKHNSIYR
jgi:FkbM family methyltransferase